MKIFFTCIAMCIVLLSIASAETPDHAATDLMDVARADGSLQCSGGAAAIDDSVAEVEAADVEVFDARTVHDGRMRIAMCGAPTGQVHVLSIGSDDLEGVQDLGFEEFSLDSD